MHNNTLYLIPQITSNKVFIIYFSYFLYASISRF